MSTAEDLTAYGTLALAVVGAVQTYVTRQAVRATVRDIGESRRTRVDASAPRVSFAHVVSDELRRPHWQNDSDINSRIEMTVEQRFPLPGMRAVPIGMTELLRASNEGTSTARLTLPRGVVELTQGDEPPRNYEAAVRLWETGEAGRAAPVLPSTFVLLPGDSIYLGVQAARPLQRWTAGSVDGVAELPDVTVTTTLVVDDGFLDGITDTTVILLTGQPLAQDPQQRGAFRWRTQAQLQVVIQPTSRVYRGESRGRRHPAWLDRRHQLRR